MFDVPGRTSLAEHYININAAHSVKLPPYRLTHAYSGTVKKEIEEILQHRTIEESSSEWFSTNCDKEG